MQYDTYHSFRTAVMHLIEGDVPSTDGITAVDTMIALGESVVHYGGNFAGDGRYIGALRASTMEAPFNEVAAANACPIPEDCMSLSILWVDGGEPLEMVAERDLRARLPHVSAAKARMAAQAGESIIFSPAVQDGAVVGGRYYAKPPALKDELHATFNRYPGLYFYAALASSAPFYGQTEKLALWQAWFRTLLDQANVQERTRVSSGGRMRQVLR